MVDPNDKRGVKAARQEFSRRGIDLSRADVRVSNGVCTVRGTVSRLVGNEPNLRSEVEIAAKVIRQKSEIRDVVLDITGNQL